MTATHRLPFRIDAVDPWSGARATTLTTLHGAVETPIFMPVATQAILRHVDTTVATELGYQVLLANTYHLLLRPGTEVLQAFGGIHPFMKWERSVLTDSGGFQIFSLPNHVSLSEERARFRSYVDGAWIDLSPERSIEVQRTIGSDIMMVLDHCVSSTSDLATTRKALELTTRWAKRSLDARADSPQAIFGIVQGGCFPELRKESAEQIVALGFDGYALGGLAVGETKAEREDTTELAAKLLPATQPRYLMGVGTPSDLLEAVRRGMDMFDCIIPTALASQGVCFTSRGKLDLRRGVYRLQETPIDPLCPCSTCSRFSRAYVSHLVKTKEPVAAQLVSVHNLTFYRRLMARMREAILSGTFCELYSKEAELLDSDDVDYPPVGPRKERE
jgi:queuine tRNA-ribosyltransferase